MGEEKYGLNHPQKLVNDFIKNATPAQLKTNPHVVKLLETMDYLTQEISTDAGYLNVYLNRDEMIAVCEKALQEFEGGIDE